MNELKTRNLPRMKEKKKINKTNMKKESRTVKKQKYKCCICISVILKKEKNKK